MSSEDSSDPMDSGNAFDGDSPGPPSPVGEQVSCFCGRNLPKVTRPPKGMWLPQDEGKVMKK